MNIGAGTIFLLILGALVLAVLAVALDRINFPQRPFRPKRIEVGGEQGPTRDRTGAHIIYEDEPTTGAPLGQRPPEEP